MFMQLPVILERDLRSQRPEGGIIKAVEVVQRNDGKWQVNVDVSWKPPGMRTACLFNVYEIKLYALAATALRHVVTKYDYFGDIVVKPKQGLIGKYLI
jgi:hypothetical protein